MSRYSWGKTAKALPEEGDEASIYFVCDAQGHRIGFSALIGPPHKCPECEEIGSSTVKTVWLAYCTKCNKYRTGAEANGPFEWVADRDVAQLFGSSGHALNSAKYHSSHRVTKEEGTWANHREFAAIEELRVVESEIRHYYKKRTIIQRWVCLNSLPSMELKDWVCCPFCLMKGVPFPDEDPVKCGNCDGIFPRFENVTTPGVPNGS